MVHDINKCRVCNATNNAMILALTSFGFAVLGLIAGYVQEPVMYPLLSMLTPISVLHHSYGTDPTVHPAGFTIARADRVLAHIIPLLVFIRAAHVGPIARAITRLSVAYIAIVYKCGIDVARVYRLDEYPAAHMSIHMVSFIGMSAYLYGWYRAHRPRYPYGIEG